MSGTVSGKSIIVTGAGRGTGAAIARAPEQAINEFNPSILIGRHWRPRDITRTTTFLAPTKPDDVTGQTIMVDGAMAMNVLQECIL